MIIQIEQLFKEKKMPNYSRKLEGKLQSDLYFEVFEKKGVKFLNITTNPKFENILDLSVPLITTHTWTYGDKLYKLANRYYSDRTKYWVIGLINNKPTDMHYKIGDKVLIPADVSIIERSIGDNYGI